MKRSDGQTPDQAPTRETAKLTLRLPQPHADALMLNAGALGLSYGDYVARLVAGSRLPQPVAERQADRAALLASNDRMAALSTDLVALVTAAAPGEGGAGQAATGIASKPPTPRSAATSIAPRR